MGRVRGFNFDAVIGIGGISSQPRDQGLSRKINWVGIKPSKRYCKIDPRGPLVIFKQRNFRLYEEKGPYLYDLAPNLANRLYSCGSRFLFSAISPTEQKEALSILHRWINTKDFEHLLINKKPRNLARSSCKRKPVCNNRKNKIRLIPTSMTCISRPRTNKCQR